MKVVILAGGDGVHFPGLGRTIPKGMAKIGETPFLCHIMKLFSCYGHNEFIIAAGIYQYDIKKYFVDYYAHKSDLYIDLGAGNVEIDEGEKVDWKIRICDTGHETKTGGRLKRIARYLGDEPFFLAYSDTIADVNINELLESHKKSGKKATMSLYNASTRFGTVEVNEDQSVAGFRKGTPQPSLVNIGFMVLEPSVLDLIPGDDTVLEKYPLEELARQGDLNSYIHHGYYIKMDKPDDLKELNALYESGKAPWEQR